MGDSASDIIKKVPIIGSALSEADRVKRQVESHDSKPVTLYLAQLFLFLVIAIYFTKLSVLGMGFVVNYGDELMAMVTYVVDVLMLFMTIDAILGISSRKPSSWRKVMRSAMLLFLFSVIGVILGSTTAAGFLVLTPAAVAVICIPIAALMFLRSVREYYVPPMMECPRLAKWIMFSVAGQLFPAERYEISY